VPVKICLCFGGSRVSGSVALIEIDAEQANLGLGIQTLLCGQ
jgi:hypothetical protein